jgi:hypothetical protein
MGLLSTLTKGKTSDAKKTFGGEKTPTTQTASKSTQAAIRTAASQLAASVKKTSSSKKRQAEGEKTGNQTSSASSASAASGDLIRWSGGGGLRFFVKSNQIHAMKEITITASPDTEDKENGDEKVTSLKKKGKIKVTINGILLAALGADVENMAMHAIDAARKGETGYLYLAGKKMFTPSFMMTKADVKNIQFSTDGKWNQCELSMELSQSSKYDGTAATSAGGSGYKFSCTVYYSGSSGAIQSVWAGSNVSKDDARKKAWAKVPKNAQWASETKNQATNQTTGRTTTGAAQGSAGNNATGNSGASTTNAINSAKKQSQKVYNNSKRTNKAK